MPNRSKLFLVFALICTAPLLILSGFLFLNNLNNAKRMMRTNLDHELAGATHSFKALLAEREQERLTIASGTPILTYIAARQGSAPATNEAGVDQQQFTKVADKVTDPPDYLKDFLLVVLADEKAYSAIACFDSGKHLLFVAEPATRIAGGPVALRTKDFLQHESKPDERIWSAKEPDSICRLIGNSSTGRILRCATPIFAKGEISPVRGALVTDLRLRELLTDVAKRSELGLRNEASGFNPASGIVVVLDQSGEIVYHTNDALTHQQVSTSFGNFAPVAEPMMAGGNGSQTFASGRDEWLAVYAPLEPAGLSLAVARDSSIEVAPARRSGWMGIGMATVFGLGMATALTTIYQRKTRSLERVTEDVKAIAKGDVDLQVSARSRDDMRPLADSVNLVTKRLREQILRESETRQFQSFVKLSAMLTHDLKNAIGGLSLLVSNMEEHYANEEFRADAMQSLTSATAKLKALVERISNPVTTLSGEFKRPLPVDLVPLVRRVLAQTMGRVSGTHHLETGNLPPSLFALVDSERIEKVIENLVLNGLEAMHGKSGTLIVEGGKDASGMVFLSIADTGVGMSTQFIDEKLFHAFATTKRSGMGLGLYTCREVVQANGGTIEVTSKQGDGTTFRVVLPSPQPGETA